MNDWHTGKARPRAARVNLLLPSLRAGSSKANAGSQLLGESLPGFGFGEVEIQGQRRGCVQE